MYLYSLYVDPIYVFILIPTMILSIWASINVNRTFEKYSKVRSSTGMTGADAAGRVLRANGVYDVKIDRVRGKLTDHYDPRNNTIYLSDAVYDNTSCAAIGVAAHEAGHAVQHAKKYLPIKIRSAIVPITNVGSKLAIPLILLGIIMAGMAEEYIAIAYAGVICFSLSTVFQLVTLPTEFNASRRAISTIESSGLLSRDEQSGAKRVLTAAALTYVAALAVSLVQLLRLLLIVGGSSRRRR